MIVRLKNDDFSRALHAVLHKRLVSFCERYSPELPSEPIATLWLQRLYGGDPTLVILIDIDNAYTVHAHVVIDIQQFGGQKIAYCMQAEGDKADVKALDLGFEQLEKIAAEVGASCTVMQVARSSKVLEKRYGYKAVRTVLLKYQGQGDADGSGGVG